ncbi:hypothetical protein ACYOEI_05675 [Singulisphaera rosea]
MIVSVTCWLMGTDEGAAVSDVMARSATGKTSVARVAELFEASGSSSVAETLAVSVMEGGADVVGD